MFPKLVRYIKSLPFFQLPEVTFERNLDDNPVYPFTPLLLTPLDQNPVYQYKRRLNRFYYSLVTCTTFSILSIILGYISNDLEILYVPLTTAVVALSVTLESATQQTVIVDPVHNSYTVYRGKRLVGTNHFHNIYIRILTRPDSGTFWAVLNGINIDSPIKLSYETANKKKLRILCKRLATRLFLNYFDPHNHSKHHVIRHKKPGVLTTSSVSTVQSCVPAATGCQVTTV